MLWKILLAIIGAYLVFIIGPAVVASFTIFREKPGVSFDKLIEPGGAFHAYAQIMCSAKERLTALPRKSVSCTTDDGLTLGADYYDPGKERTAIFVHGYRSDPMANFAVQADVFARHGYNLLIVSQRGDGSGAHVPTSMGLKEQFDVICWLDWVLKQPGVNHTVVYGMSMGGATLAYASDKLDPAVTDAIVIDCGYGSPYEQIMDDCRKRHLPGPLLLPVVRLISKARFKIDIRQRTEDSLKNAAVPCYFLHGTNDKKVPFVRGRNCFEACTSRKAFFAAEGADHTEAFLIDPARAEEELFRFIQPSEIKEEN